MISRGTKAGSERPKRRHPSNPLQPQRSLVKPTSRDSDVGDWSPDVSSRSELKRRYLDLEEFHPRTRWPELGVPSLYFLNSEGVAPISIGSTLVSGFGIPISGRETWISDHFFSDSTDSSSNSVDEVLNSGRGFAKSIRSAPNSLQAI